MRAALLDSALHRISEIELPVCHACHRWGDTRALRRFFGVISRIGDGHYWYVTLALVLLVQGSAALGLFAHMTLAGAVCHGLYKVLKRRTARVRPCDSAANGESPFTLAVAPLDKYSFPSGHTLHVVFFTCVLGAYLPALLWLFVPFAVLTGTSRVVLGLHYPTDVAAGALLGAVLGNLSLLIF